jgi:hypothetical protein
LIESLSTVSRACAVLLTGRHVSGDYLGTDAVTGLEGLLSVPVVPTLVT